jgi:hypothetical protein
VRTIVADAGAERLRDPKAEPSADWWHPSEATVAAA